MDMQEIEQAMHTLANGDTTYDAVMRLAALKVVRDHLSGENANAEPQTIKAVPQEPIYESEFQEVMAQIPYDKAMQVIDEHLEALRIVCPKEYDSLMRKLWRLK